MNLKSVRTGAWVTTVTGAISVALLSGIAYPQGPAALVQILTGGAVVSTSNRLPVDATGTITPTVATTTEVSVAPTATTFASLLATSATRKGCLVQNIGTTLGYIYFGTTGSATTANSFQIAAGSAISCATQTGAVLTDNIAGTCASGTCAFIIGSQ